MYPFSYGLGFAVSFSYGLGFTGSFFHRAFVAYLFSHFPFITLRSFSHRRFFLSSRSAL